MCVVCVCCLVVEYFFMENYTHTIFRYVVDDTPRNIYVYTNI